MKRTAAMPMMGVAGLATAVIAIWKWGLLPTSVVLFSTLALMLCRNGRWRQVLSTPNGTIWWGGLLMWFSAFLSYAYGPMGGEVQQAAYFRNIDLTWVGTGWLLSLSGIFLGATIATLAVIAIAVDSTKTISRLRYVAVAIWLVVVAMGNIVVWWKLSERALTGRGFATLVISAATIAAVAIVAWLDWPSTSKAAAVHIVGSLSLLFGIVPIGGADEILVELTSYRIGYWQFCTGNALVIAGSCWVLAQAIGRRKHCQGILSTLTRK